MASTSATSSAWRRRATPATPSPTRLSARTAHTDDTHRLAQSLARALSLDSQRVEAGHARLTREDFSYRRCGPWEIDLPMDGIVISVQLQSGRWLNAEVHPHEWHFRQKLDWMLKVSAAFVFVGAVALFFIRRVGRPLNQLTAAARSFADGMKATEVAEDGPIDLRRAIRSFNAMQRQVADEMARRTQHAGGDQPRRAHSADRAARQGGDGRGCGRARRA